MSSQFDEALKSVHSTAYDIGQVFIERIPLGDREDIKEELLSIMQSLEGHPMSNALRMMVVGVLHGIGIEDFR